MRYITVFFLLLTVVWLGLCRATAMLANKQGRNPAAWGILALVLSPFLVILLLLLLGKPTTKAIEQQGRQAVKVRCADCEATVDESATYCPKCGHELEPATA